METFDGIRAGVNRRSLAVLQGSQRAVYGANRPGAKVSQGLRDSFWLQGMLAGYKAVLDCIKAFFGDGFHRRNRRSSTWPP
jgi:non-heme chloroperoxidase